MIKHLLFYFIVYFMTANLWAQPSGETMTLKTETGELAGTLLYPEANNKVPVVLIIAGSGPTDRNGNNPMMTNNSLKMLAEGLFENKIASLRFDKRGIGKSAGAMGKEIDLRFETYIEDAKAWADFLIKDTRFKEIVIVGHSEGSLIGMIAAKEIGAAKFISIAGPGVPAGEIIREQLKAQPPFVTDLAYPILDKMERGETQDSIPPMLNALFRPSVQPYIISWFKYDPQQEIVKLNCPVLILQGSTDIQVGVGDAEKLATANPKARKVILEGMNHILKDAEADRMKNIATYADPKLPLKKGLIELIVTFMNE